MKPMITDEGIISRFMRCVKKGPTEDDCWEWLRATNREYGIFVINRSTESAHQVSYRIFVGPIPDGMEIRHKRKCRCSNPNHIELGTHQQNQADMRRDKTTNTKLSDEEVEIIRKSPDTYKVLAKAL